MLKFYQGYDNVQIVELLDDDVAQTLASVTKVELTFNGVTYDSDTTPDAFDWVTDSRQLILKMGMLPNIPVIKDKKAEIVTIDPSNPNGVVWGRIAIQIDEVS